MRSVLVLNLRSAWPLQISELELGNFKFSDLKIIVVDDDVIVCEHTTELLRQIGIRSDWETDRTAGGAEGPGGASGG